MSYPRFRYFFSTQIDIDNRKKTTPFEYSYDPLMRWVLKHTSCCRFAMWKNNFFSSSVYLDKTRREGFVFADIRLRLQNSTGILLRYDNEFIVLYYSWDSAVDGLSTANCAAIASDLFLCRRIVMRRGLPSSNVPNRMRITWITIVRGALLITHGHK